LVPFGESNPGDRCAGFPKPTPSVLRVSHSLDGLIPPEPRGFVSRHIRPWGFDLQSFSLSASRDASRRPLLSCRWISSNSCELPPQLSSASLDSRRRRAKILRDCQCGCQKNTDNIIRIESVSKPPKRHGERLQQPLERDAKALSKAPLGSATSPVEAGSNRREPRLQSLTPAESPFPIRQPLGRQSRPMLSWPFSPPRPTRPAVGLAPSPHVLAAWPPSTALRRERPKLTT
jgi:hypothetical protein